VADHYDSASGLTLTASRADLLKTRPNHGHAHLGLVTRFSRHIAQFWRDWTAILGYRSADQNEHLFVSKSRGGANTVQERPLVR
jgi:hypothetical protein